MRNEPSFFQLVVYGFLGMLVIYSWVLLLFIF